MCARAVALWCALALAAGAAAYTVDCNHEYTDCDTEMSKLTGDEDDLSPASATAPVLSESKVQERIQTTQTITTTPVPVTRTTSIPITINENKTAPETTTEEVTTEALKPQPRLLNLSVDDLKNFAFALHNQTKANTGKLTDLSDVTLDGEEEFEPKVERVESKHDKDLPDKFYTNLQAPFHPIITVDRSDEGREEGEVCRENGVAYKPGDRLERACDESCECLPTGVFECSPRCKHPYIRRGRRLNDPLCFESPVDDCCSIIACATGNGDTKVTKLEVCRYGNDTYPVGATWNIACDQRCACEKNSIVTCKPRCNPLPQSDKCINVQDPKDACCEVQVCDVSQNDDAHEDPVENATSSTTTTEAPSKISTLMEIIFDDDLYSNQSIVAQNAGSSNLTGNVMASTMRPLVLAEPIGSVKVLQNNSVQVNLMHVNSSEDPIHLLLSNDNGKTFKEVELKYDNMILNLDGGKDYILKTKETGTKFNFTITSTDPSSKKVTEELIQVTEKIGCHHDGKFYEVGEEFHIGCTELCECTGAETRECALLECPSHVGLELVSKGCVRWAPSPPPKPPNCCPRAARCLSDGTCHYKEVAIPNWTEVPISLTGCEQRCFCENGELDCQEVCTPLPPLPPQTMRCPPLHRPAPVNISDDDCCKQWGCIPNAGNTSHSFTMTMPDEVNFVALVNPITSVAGPLPPPEIHTLPMDFYKHLSPVKSVPKILKTFSTYKQYVTEIPGDEHDNCDNITSLSKEDTNNVAINILPETNHDKPLVYYKKPTGATSSHQGYFFPPKPEASKKENLGSYKMSDSSMHDILQEPPATPMKQLYGVLTPSQKYAPDSVTKIPVSTFDKNRYFMPSFSKNNENLQQNYVQPKVVTIPLSSSPYFRSQEDLSVTKPRPTDVSTPLPDMKEFPGSSNFVVKHGSEKLVTVLRTMDLKQKRPVPPDNLHVLIKSPNPYETVLLRAVPNAKKEMVAPFEPRIKTPTVSGKPYSTLDLENFLSQMEVESEVNRNLGRSADKNEDSGPGTPPPNFPGPPQMSPPSFTSPPLVQPSRQPFLPTVPPDESVHFPGEDDLPDNDVGHRPGIPGLPPLPVLPPSEEIKKLTVLTLVSDTPTSVKMLFGLPSVLVGLRGSVDLRYTDKPDDDIANWQSQVFAPADEVLTTSRLEFRLTGLYPSTVYRIRGKLYLHNLAVEPESEVYSIRTLDLPTIVPVEEKRREIDSRLTVLDVNDTVAHVSWRRFTEEELQFIDAIQVRYRPVGTPIYSMTELLHHSRAAASLLELRPGSRYEASLVLVPPPRATTELVDPTVVEFTTAPYVDPYNWSVSIEARSVGSEAAELTWAGVPSPAERWVRVYRAAHACGAVRREHDAFRLAARDLPPSITLSGLEPDTRCRVWLELFLTNGKVKTSNVIEIHTKTLDSPEPIDNAIEASSIGGRGTASRGDYYGALVVVGVVAALGALTSLLLLLVVLRRHRPRSVPITPVPTAPRESSLPPYDNPAYKLELQQETMDL